MTTTLLGSITMRALGIHARRILDFLMHEHAAHGGRENGWLAAPYRHLRTWGLSDEDIRKGFEELFITGFVRRTHQGLRQAGGKEPSRYALTWLPTLCGSDDAAPPTHEWLEVIATLGPKKIGNVQAVRVWLKAEVAAASIGRQRKRRATPQTGGGSPLIAGPTILH